MNQLYSFISAKKKKPSCVRGVGLRWDISTRVECVLAHLVHPKVRIAKKVGKLGWDDLPVLPLQLDKCPECDHTYRDSELANHFSLPRLI